MGLCYIQVGSAASAIQAWFGCVQIRVVLICLALCINCHLSPVNVGFGKVGFELELGCLVSHMLGLVRIRVSTRFPCYKSDRVTSVRVLPDLKQD